MVSAGDTVSTYFNRHGGGGGVGVVLGKVGLGLWEQFQFSGGGGGECSGTKFQNRGVLDNLAKIFWKPSWLVHHR